MSGSHGAVPTTPVHPGPPGDPLPPGTAPWTESDIGDLTGRTVLVTGASSGIGLHTARILAGHGAGVVLGCRDPGRARGAADLVAAGAGGAPPRVLTLDLASLASVRRAAAELTASVGGLDALVCNAGVMLPPPGRTEDGFEQHLGVNHLGHFALTGLVLDLLLRRPGSRVVVVSSIAAGLARLPAGDPLRDRRGPAFGAYARSKLAGLLFTRELQVRLAAAGAGTVALSAHPGGSPTGITRSAPRLTSVLDPDRWPAVTAVLSHPPAVAARSVVRAVTDPSLRGGDHVGPGGRLGLTGDPVLTRPCRRSGDRALARAVWTRSEQLTGVVVPLPATG